MSSSFKQQEKPYLSDTPENQELDEAFSKMNIYLFAAENRLVKQLLYANLDALAKEAIKRDSSLKVRLSQYLITLKGYIS